MSPELPVLAAGVYRHYKGPLYQVFGYGHDANADSLMRWPSPDHVDAQEPLGERAVVVYMALELTDAHTGPRLAVRNVFGEDSFFDRVHVGQPERFTEGTVCDEQCWYRALNVDGLNEHKVTLRFEYLGPTWEGAR